MPDVHDPEITPTWLEIYEVIRQHWLDHGYAPSQTEIMRAVGCSHASIQNAFRHLKAKGHVTHQKHEARSIKPVDFNRRLYKNAPPKKPAAPDPWADMDEEPGWSL